MSTRGSGFRGRTNRHAAAVELLGSGTPLALLVYLACSPGRAASRERLADLLWADIEPEKARASVRQAL